VSCRERLDPAPVVCVYIGRLHAATEGMEMTLVEIWLLTGALVERALALVLIAHAVLHKRDVGSAIGWSGLVWLAPLFGSLFYMMLGINRIERRATRLREGAARPPAAECDSSDCGIASTDPELASLATLVDRVARVPLTRGNRVVPLPGGDVAYPAMLEAIAGAERSIGLASYIFDNDRAGRPFVDALALAHDRGVAVRVLIDGVGRRYSRPPITDALGARGIPCALFLKSALPWRNPYLNLRNHRKLLLVDGRIGFTGGMNIREGCLLALDPAHPVQDLHFRFDGPVVRQMVDTFALDWAFTEHEQLDGTAWYPEPPTEGTTLARGVADGPDEDFEAIRQVLLGALAQARRRVRICTPYFLPDPALIAALNVTALRGVEVEIVVPEKPNLRVVHWASMAQAGLLLPSGCRMLMTPPPFDHTKLMLVDDGWAFVGSTNWDARSLRLNFEFNIECYDRALVADLHRIVDTKVATAQPLTVEALERRPFPVKLRDGVARLFTPYL
jgi:cardiolipin synthase